MFMEQLSDSLRPVNRFLNARLRFKLGQVCIIIMITITVTKEEKGEEKRERRGGGGRRRKATDSCFDPPL